YRGIDETLACIDSVLAAKNATPIELLVLDDASPEPALSRELSLRARRGDFVLLVNDTNLGFVGTVNRGMRWRDDRDVILLNSDPEVYGDWVDRIRAAAYRHPDVGTVTPLSNNATICSYPRFCEDNTLPRGTGAAELDAIAARVNQG